MPNNKIISVEVLAYYDSKLKTQANILQRGTAYTLNQFVHRGNIYLKCTTAGTTATTALSLNDVQIGDSLTDGTVVWEVFDPFAGGSSVSISNWQSSNNYAVDDLVIYSDYLYKCITANNDSSFTSSKWQAISKDGVEDWGSGNQYKKNDLVMQNGDLYICITAHTSSSSFSTDELKWLKIGGSSSGNGNIGQVTKLGVTAPIEVEIPMPSTTTFDFPSVEVLKLDAGQSNVSTNALNFSVGDGDKFVVENTVASESPLIIFDGVAKPNHEVEYNFNTPVQMSNYYYSMTDEIDLTDYKLVSEVALD